MKNNYVATPACLLDCFPSGHCLSSLLLDYTAAGGVCGGSYISQYYPDLWPASDMNCTFLEKTDKKFTDKDDYQIKVGICSKRTEKLLYDQDNCIRTLYEQSENILVSLQTLIWSSCTWDAWQDFKPDPASITTTTVSSLISDPLQAFEQGINPNYVGKQNRKNACFSKKLIIS